ncbi:protein translocase subunit SecD [Streptomyces sp. 4N509B]|uniref:protein translocase subunit SecD n=1 Tax=Streptomyces sp. 4N509B TaxID=3457413 RepID=UPI003FCFEC55
MVALTGGMFLSGHTTPRLGIDLAGGTSITLEAVAERGNEGAINPTNLNTAVSIIERRVNGLGVSEAEVQTQGDRNIIVNIPKGTDEQEARDQVGTTAELGFRPVLTVTSAQQVPQEEQPEDSQDGSGDSGDGSGEGSGDEGSTGDGSGEEGSGDEGSSEGGGQDSEEGSTEDGSGDGGADSSGDTSGEESTDQSLPAPGAGSATTVTPASYQQQDQDEEQQDSQEQDQQDENGTGDGSGGGGGSGEGSEEGSGEDAGAGGQATDVQTQFAELDCSTERSRLRASQAAAQAADDAQVAVCDSDGLEKFLLGPVAVPGTDVSDASAVFDSQRGQGWIVQMEFSNAGAERFADITGQLAGQTDPMNRFAIVLDGEVVSAPSVDQRLGGGRAEIYGNFNQESAEELANILKYGSLPLNFEEASVSTVSPTLGGEQLRAGLIAGAIGLGLVVLYLVLYYRGLSLIAFTSLAASAILTYTIMSLLGPAIGFALNLPAVCGAIVAIGITADSFIVYFERIRDEVREGRSLRPAVERAWPRARRTILVSDFVSFLAAAVLFVVTVGKVQGFAFTLGLTTLLDVVVVFLFTKPLMTILARRKFFASGHPWSGLDPRRLGARSPRGGRRPVTVSPDPKEA